MHFSRYGALVGLLGCAVEASPAVQPGSVVVRSEENEVRGLLGGSTKALTYDLARSWKDETLYSGTVSDPTADLDAIQLGLALPEAALEGTVDLSTGDDFLLSPTVRLDLGGIKAYLKIALDATAGVAESVNLLEDVDLSLAVPGLAQVEIEVGIALDLIFSVSAAIDIETVINVQFPEGAYLEIDILSKEIVKQDLLSGLIVEAVPKSIGSLVSLEEDIELNVALRLRTGLGISAGVEIIGLDLGAGAQVAIWANLFDYTSVISQTTSGISASASDSLALTAGVLVELDVEIEEIDLSLAPSIIVTIATVPTEVVTVTIGEGSGQSWPWRSGTAMGSGSGNDSPASPSATSANDAEGTSPTTPPAGMTTSTVVETKSYTLTSCAASVKNCPNTYTQEVVTSVVQSYTTVCPVTATETAAAVTDGASTSTGPAPATATSTESVPIPTITTTKTMTQCPASTSTQTIPTTVTTPAHTVVITHSYTPAPQTQTVGTTSTQPTTPEAQPTTTEALPTSSEAQPTSSEAQPTSPEAQPTGSEAQPTGSEAQPTSPEAQPTSPEAQPTGSEAQPTGSEAQPTGPQPSAVQPSGAQPSGAQPTGAQPSGPQPSGTWSNSPIYTTGPAPVRPSGVAAPSGFYSRANNGTVPRPSTGVPFTPVTSAPPASATTKSPGGQASPSNSPVTAGAGKVGFGLLAAFAPLFVALM